MRAMQSYCSTNRCPIKWSTIGPNKVQRIFGGYGSGKTVSTCQDVIHHILTTPNGLTLIGAQTFPQLEQTAMKEFLIGFLKISFFITANRKIT